MTTLKKEIKIKRTANSSHSKANVANELWEYFIKSSKGCKRGILCLLKGSLVKNGRCK
jgi:hypothetical protein